jgi:hypothetical protein
MSSTVDNEENPIVGYREGQAYLGLSGKLEYEKVPVLKSEHQKRLRSLVNDLDEEWRRIRGTEDEFKRPIDLLEKVASDKFAPVDVLETLSKDEEPLLRVAVAKNPSSPPSLLSSLATDENFHVRLAVAKNPKTEVDDLDKLSTDSIQAVANFAKENLKGRDFTGWVFKDAWE